MKRNKKGDRFNKDGNTIKMRSGGGSKYWYIFVDKATGLKPSIFTESNKNFSQA